MQFYHFQIDTWIFFDALTLRAEKGQNEILAIIYYRYASFCIGYERATTQEYKI